MTSCITFTTTQASADSFAQLQDSFRQEVTLLGKLDHPGIIKCHGCVVDKAIGLCVVMEDCKPFVSLGAHLQNDACILTTRGGVSFVV